MLYFFFLNPPSFATHQIGSDLGPLPLMNHWFMIIIINLAVYETIYLFFFLSWWTANSCTISSCKYLVFFLNDRRDESVLRVVPHDVCLCQLHCLDCPLIKTSDGVSVKPIFGCSMVKSDGKLAKYHSYSMVKCRIVYMSEVSCFYFIFIYIYGIGGNGKSKQKIKGFDCVGIGMLGWLLLLIIRFKKMYKRPCALKY